MNYEEAVEVVNRLSKAWNSFSMRLYEFADMLAEAINSFTLFRKSAESEVKKRKEPLRRPSYKLSVRYNYIPRAPRNLPYQRRAY